MSLYQQLLSALSGTPTQNERLIRLRTPLGAEVLLAERMSLHEHIGPAVQTPAGFQAEVFALAADAHIELKTLLGQPALIELEQANANMRPWHGHITHAALVGSDGGLARYRLTIEPWLAFLAHRQDSWVFQDASVIDVIEEVFADYNAQGKLAPDWRFELADPAAYPKRSLCIQYQESDLAFVQRLLLEEGLFCWWEHEAAGPAGQGDTLGKHTLVIADHNGAIAPCTQPRVRFTQAGMALEEDSLTRWRRQAAVHTARIEQASQDYRSNGGSVALRAQSQSAQGAPDTMSALTLTDIPGLYAYEDSAQGQRLALRQMQALDAQRHRARAFGTLRAAAPATRFTLAEHPLHKFGSADDEFIILGAHHRARSNLRADHKAQVLSLLGAIAQDQQDAAPASPNASEEPVYSSTLTLQPAALAVRMGAQDKHGRPDVRLHPRPTVHGVQTALVVGAGEAIHTDRDHRIKVQFHWQRGDNASHRMPHSAGSNAPASEQSGTWVRVSEAWAGANWGANFTPRVGQEVMVGFIGGDIDRPVVSGSVYNGRGQENAQSNQAAAGAAGATGNAPAWFPGDKAGGNHQGHQHTAVLAGHKSQELSASSSGTGGYNQLVFDDSAGANRIELATTSAQTRLQLGHLLHQTDNQRLQARGHGVDLSSAAWGAVRAGSGLLISAHARAGGSLGASQQIDAREPQAQLDQGRELIHTLAESAQQHKAKLTAEPDVIGAKKEQKNKQLPVEQGLWASGDALDGKDTRGSGAEGEGEIGGGTGTVAAWTRPDLVIAAPAGIGSHTPANAIYSAGNTASMSAGQDIQHTVQANHSTVVNKGLILYTYGKASNAQKPNTETGIALHAASGNVNLQSQTAATKITADKAITVASTQDMVRITAPEHVLLTAAGAALELKGGNITLKGPGKVEFRASMKELKGPASATQSLELKKPGELKGCLPSLTQAAQTQAASVTVG